MGEINGIGMASFSLSDISKEQLVKLIQGEYIEVECEVFIDIEPEGP